MRIIIILILVSSMLVINFNNKIKMKTFCTLNERKHLTNGQHFLNACSFNVLAFNTFNV